MWCSSYVWLFDLFDYFRNHNTHEYTALEAQERENSDRTRFVVADSFAKPCSGLFMGPAHWVYDSVSRY